MAMTFRPPLPVNVLALVVLGLLSAPALNAWEEPSERRSVTEPRLGVQVSAPSPVLVDQLDLPRGQGLVVEAVSPNSAAGKAGMKANDILLELNSKPVPENVEEISALVGQIKANTSVEAVVLRKGIRKTIRDLKLPAVEVVARPEPREVDLPRPRIPVPRGGVLPEGRPARMMPLPSTRPFTVRRSWAGQSIEVSGKVVDGQARATQIAVRNPGILDIYRSLDELPMRLRAEVERILAEVERAGR
jgi:membrane-associated protease RseP (regulator of RpoE activity)